MPLRSSSGSARPASRRGIRSRRSTAARSTGAGRCCSRKRRSTSATVWDTTIPSPAGPLGIRVYRPDGGPPRPIFVYLHGGGWTLGDLDTHDTVCRRISRRRRLHGRVAVDYRLAPEHPYPAAMDDTIAAVRWLAANGGGARRRPDPAGARRRQRRRQPDRRGGASGCATKGGPRVALQVLIYPATAAHLRDAVVLRERARATS